MFRIVIRLSYVNRRSASKIKGYPRYLPNEESTKNFWEKLKTGDKNVSPNFNLPFKIFGKKGKREVFLFILSTRDII